MSWLSRRRSPMSELSKEATLKELRQIPGIGKSIAHDL